MRAHTIDRKLGFVVGRGLGRLRSSLERNPAWWGCVCFILYLAVPTGYLFWRGTQDPDYVMTDRDVVVMAASLMIVPGLLVLGINRWLGHHPGPLARLGSLWVPLGDWFSLEVPLFTLPVWVYRVLWALVGLCFVGAGIYIIQEVL